MKRRTVNGFLALVAACALIPGSSEASDGIVALQTADPSCPVAAGFYFNCGTAKLYGRARSQHLFRPRYSSSRRATK